MKVGYAAHYMEDDVDVVVVVVVVVVKADVIDLEMALAFVNY
jgi:hypothetical protein